MRSRDLTPTKPAAPVVYIDPAAQQMVVLDPKQLAEQRRQDAILYARWRARQAATAERDRKARRVLLIGAAVAVPTLLGFGGVLGWLTYRALSGAATGAGKTLAGLLVVVALVAAVAAGGHRCITVVKHWH